MNANLENATIQISDSVEILPEDNNLPEVHLSQQSKIHENHGLIPRVVHDVFHDIKKEFEESKFGSLAEVEVEIGYYEVYNERLFDLFDERREKRVLTPLQSFISLTNELTNNSLTTVQKNMAEAGCFIENATQLRFNCNSGFITPQAYFTDFINSYTDSKKLRTVRSTDQNYSSSRSHAVIQIDIKVVLGPHSPARIGRINLVDLAGSEIVGRSVSSAQLFNKNLRVHLYRDFNQFWRKI